LLCFGGRAPKCSGCRGATHGRDVTSVAGSAPQEGAAGAPQPRHMTPCACHCAACRVAGHGDGACVVLCAGLHALFDGKADVVDLALRHYYRACSWGTARFDAGIGCVQYGPGLGDVIAAGTSDGRIHFICAQTGEKILSPLSCDSPVLSIDWHENRIVAGCHDGTIKVFDAQSGDRLSTVNVDAGKYGVQSVSFSPKGDMVAAGCYSRKIFFVDAAAGEIKSSLRGHSGVVRSVCFSSDGKKLTSGSADTTVRNWDPATRASLS
jgi:WD40 repeat protein